MDIPLSAHVGACHSAFVASLSDGRCIAAASLQNLARELCRSEVLPRCVRFEWRAGERMLTAGEQVALNAELRSLQPMTTGLPALAAGVVRIPGVVGRAV